eukprot:5362167-Pyramimonas_sp.AAC.1
MCSFDLSTPCRTLRHVGRGAWRFARDFFATYEPEEFLTIYGPDPKTPARMECGSCSKKLSSH